MKNRTKSAISQTIKKLMENHLVYKERSKENAKEFLLYPTEKGIELSIAHKMFDLADIATTSELLSKKCSAEEINIFYKVIQVYINLLREE